jgi:hypothetical protein
MMLIMALARAVDYAGRCSQILLEDIVGQARCVAQELCRRRSESATEDLDDLLAEVWEKLIERLDPELADVVIQVAAALADCELEFV